MPTTEHILLESDVREIPDLQSARKVHARVELRSRLRRRVLQLEIIDYYYLSVHLRSLATELEYVLDLRFVDTPLRFARRVAWRCMTPSLVLLALTVGAARVPSAAARWWQQDRLAVCGTLVALW